MKKVCIWILLALGIMTAVSAQDFRATITGIVTDQTRAAVPDAQVRAIQRGTNQVVETKTNREGYYTLTYLQPSTYDIEVTAPGFSKLRRENITLMVADKVDLPLVLELGKVSEQVTVTAEVEVVQTADASGGMNFDSMMTSEYPLSGRQVYMLMDLTPGVLFTQEEFGTTGHSGTRNWDVNAKYVMNGGVEGTNAFALNGAPISLTGTWQLAPNVDAVQEFKVMTNTYDAAIGRTGGGAVNTTLKSGSNVWRGTMGNSYRNTILDANFTQNNRVGAPRGKHIWNQFSGTLGGAIRKDKDFIFVSFEGLRERIPFPAVSNTPPLDLRDGQHFTDYRITINDPLTVHTCVPSVDRVTSCSRPDIRNPFPGNVIPASRINPIGKKILSLYPAPNMPGLTQNFVATNNVGVYRTDQPIGRWDRVIGDKDRFYAVVTFQKGREFRNQTGFPPPVSVGNMHSQRQNMNYIIDWTRIVSPTAVLDIRASYGRFTSMFPYGLMDSGFTADDLGMTQMIQAPTAKAKHPPRIQLDQYSDLFSNNANMYNWNTDNQWNLVPTITVTRGSKTIKTGADLIYAARGNGSVGYSNGWFQFTRKWTQRYPLVGGNTSDGSGVADMLLGHPNNGQLDWTDTYYRSWPYFGFFVQTDWKVRRNLTLNLGLRYDVQIPFVERWDRQNAGFDFNAKNPVSDAVLAQWRKFKAQYDATNPRFPYPDPPIEIRGGKTFIQPGGPRRVYDTDWTNIQPRFGLAWQFLSRTVLRTGFGIYHRTATQTGYTDGFSQATDYIESLDGGLTPSSGFTGPYSLQNPFPDGIIPPTGRELGLLTNIGRAVNFDGRQRPIPRTFQYSFGFQRRTFFNILIDASYVGSITKKETVVYDMNFYQKDAILQGRAVSNYMDRTVNNPFYGILPPNATLGASATIAARELYRNFPGFQGITMQTNPWGSYRYDGLQLRVEKRFTGNRSTSGALTAVFSYTFSKNFQNKNRRNSWNLEEPVLHQLVSYDKPQNLSLSGIWDIPVGKGRHFYNQPGAFMDKVVSGWTVNWIFRYYSGNPVAWPNVQFSCSSYLVENQTRDRWFNNDRSCYRAWPAYTYSDFPDRFPWLRQMDYRSVNMSMNKTFRLNERWRFQLRGEAFNLTNTPYYGPPDTGYQNARFGMLPLDQRNFPRFIQITGKFSF